VCVRREEEVHEVPSDPCPRSADRSLALAVALPPRCFARMFTGGGARDIMTPSTQTLKTGTGTAAMVPGTAMVVTPQGPRCARAGK
jgi:hypothetical protein